jgi:hypothetical protein
MLITTSIPNFIGGISQQPPSIRSSSEAEDIENAVPSPVEGLIKRPPTEHVAAVANSAGVLRNCTTAQPPFVHLIERDEAEKYILTILQDGSLDIYDLSPGANYGLRKTLYTGASVSLGSASATQRKALTIGDVTFIANGTVPVASGTDTITQVPSNYNRTCLVWIRQSNYDREFIIKLTSGSPPVTTTVTHKVSSSGGGSDTGTNHAALDLADKINNVATYTNTSAVDSTIYIQSTADFTLVLEDDFAGEGMTIIRDQVERLEDLPPTAPNGYMVKVTGGPESVLDDYYVKFTTDSNGSFTRGIWVECPAPGIKYKWDNASLPKILIRQSDGTFYLKNADGTTPGTNVPAGANYSAYKWAERLVGDDTTNPYPSFTGLKIQDMVFYQNRIGFMSGENIVFSEVSEFFNFFRTTTLEVLDSDPIDVSSSNPKVGKITAAIPFNRDLILFTPTNQMVLRGGEVLSPKSIAMLPAADFENLSNTLRPVPTANSIFFGFSNGGFTGVRELVPQPALDGAYYANDLTNNVSRLIPGSPSHMAATTHDNLAMVVSSGNIYGYRYFNSGNERVQSAWFRFTFNDSSTVSGAFAKAVWAGFIESEMYVVMLRTYNSSSNAYITVEKMRLGAGVNDSATSGKNWLTHLDQRIRRASGAGSYNSTTGRTTFNLPKPMSYRAGYTKVVSEDGYQLSIVSGTNFSGPSGAEATVEVAGDWSAKAVWIGTIYTMTYEMSTPYLKARVGQGKASIVSGRYQLRNLTLLYADSSYFRVTVAIDKGDTYVYPFTGDIIGIAEIGDLNLSSGSFRVPVFSKNDNVTIKIVNDSPLPSKILSGELEAYYNDRATRYD